MPGARARTRLLAFGTMLVAGAIVGAGMASPAAAAPVVDRATAVARILADTNALRAANGKPPLVENTAIDAVAATWAQEMSVPTAEGGPGFVHNPSFFTQMPSGATSGGENIAAGFTYDTVVSAGWAKSPGHLQNLLGNWTDIGIGYFQSADGSSTYFVQDFGYYPAHVGAAPAPPRASTAEAPVPKVVGNSLVDARTGAPWVAHAVNWPSFEYACQQGWGYASGGRSATAAEAMVSWGITAVRLPLNQDCWLGTDESPRFGTAAGYRAAVRDWVDTLNAAGLVVLLDLHWSAPAGIDSDGQRGMADPQSLTFWQQVASAYSQVPSVMFDAFNEPYSRGSSQLSWSCWAAGGCTMPTTADTQPIGTSTFTTVGMQRIVQAIRAANATQPILLGGLDYANDLRGWVAATRSFGDDQLVASWHNYPGQRCDDVACWNAEIAPVAAQVPVIATEFGETDGGTSFLTTFMDWADDHGLGYAPWAWWWTDSSDGAEANAYALVQYGTFTPQAPEGTTYHDHLAVQVDRVAGTDRYTGSVAVSQEAYPDGASTVYVVTGLTAPDALSAAATAATVGGPVLLTPRASLPDDVVAEIVRLAPRHVVVVGGPASVSPAVFDELQALVPDTVRIGGADRYEVSRNVLTEAFSTVSSLYVVTGETFPDALSASPAAVAEHGAVLLVPGRAAALDDTTTSLIRSLDPARIRIVGGTASVSSSIEKQLSGIAATTRLAGADRYAASLAVNAAVFPHSDTIYLATGENFPDALTGAAWAARGPAPLLVVPGTCVPTATLSAIRALGATKVTLLGGPNSLTEGVARLSACG